MRKGLKAHVFDVIVGRRSVGAVSAANSLPGWVGKIVVLLGCFSCCAGRIIPIPTVTISRLIRDIWFTNVSQICEGSFHTRSSGSYIVTSVVGGAANLLRRVSPHISFGACVNIAPICVEIKFIVPIVYFSNCKLNLKFIVDVGDVEFQLDV